MKDESDSRETKEKIIDAARTLFANKGFSGTSVRAIASSAGVNVALINYHFNNKQELYNRVFVEGFTYLQDEICKIVGSSENCNFVKNILRIFKFLNKNDDLIFNYFRLITHEASESIDFSLPDEHIGPPGTPALLQCLKNEIPKGVEHESMLWAVRTVFSYMLHSILMSKAPYLQKTKFKKALCSSALEKNVERLSTAIFENLLKEAHESR